MAGDPPSARVRELIRQGAALAFNSPQDWLDQLDIATGTSKGMQSLAEDPVLAEGIRRSNRSNYLHWVAANISHPGEPVPANLGTETLAIARDLSRRGLDESTAVDAYRVGQNLAWRFWMHVAFTLTSDPGELHSLLDASAHSMTAFVDLTISGICHQLRIERDKLRGETYAGRMDALTLVLDGAPIALHEAEQRLGYRLRQTHTAAVVWTADSDTNLTNLDSAARALVDSSGGRPALSVLANAATRWVWLSGGESPNLTEVGAVVDHLAGVRIAIGATADGIEGFRRSHLDAVTTQRIVAQLDSPQSIFSFHDVELAAVILADPERAARFIEHTLGDFESAGDELQRTVLTFIREQCNVSRTAARLFTHRNTLLRRLARAHELLPRPLEHNIVEVAAALETRRWRRATR
jgi:DNA-binding PucR family transcriptional regulator